MAQKKSKPKYRAIPTYVDGVRFASKAEAGRYETLRMLEKGGAITELGLQPAYVLQDATDDMRKIVYVADFVYVNDHGQRIIEDVKGTLTPIFKMKLKMFHHRYPHLTLNIVKMRHSKRRGWVATSIPLFPDNEKT